MATEIITTYHPTVGIAAVNIEESGAEKIYDFFQSLGGKSFLFSGDHGFLEFVPVPEAGNSLTRYGRQLILLFKHAVKALNRPNDKKQLYTPGNPIGTVGRQTDFFCQDRAKAQVIFEGKEVKVLYPDNPITERHFLFATKEHRDSFKDMTKSEFVEVLDLARRVGNLYSGEKHILCKTGFDAGQTVPHFHLHLVIATSNTDGIYGRLKVARNIIFNMIPGLSLRLRGEALLEKASYYKKELQCLSS